MGICSAANCNMTPEELSILASGFFGGIGGTFDQGSCGALTGAVMALGILSSNENKIKEDSKKLFNDFKKEYSSVTCGAISKNGEDKSPCGDCCVFAGNMVVELLKD